MLEVTEHELGSLFKVPSEGIKLVGEALPDLSNVCCDARVLISHGCIRVRLRSLAEELHNSILEGGRVKCDDVCFVPILKGAFVFAADLLRELERQYGFDARIAFLRAASYGLSSKSSGNVRITRIDIPEDVERVVFLEDIIDTGHTLKKVKDVFEAEGRKVWIVSLLDKKSRREVAVKPDLTGFEIPDFFVTGYGLDYAERMRFIDAVLALKSTEIKH
jgi:hypoxanthine phosphoribosyltransferase